MSPYPRLTKSWLAFTSSQNIHVISSGSESASAITPVPIIMPIAIVVESNRDIHFFFIFLPPFYQIAYIDLFRFCLFRHIDTNHYAIIIFFGHSKQNIIIRSFLYILYMYSLILMDMRCFDIFCFFTKICFISQEYRCLFIVLVHQQKKQAVDF